MPSHTVWKRYQRLWFVWWYHAVAWGGRYRFSRFSSTFFIPIYVCLSQKKSHFRASAPSVFIGWCSNLVCVWPIACGFGIFLSRTASFERGRRCEEKFVNGKFHEIRPPTSEVDFEVQNRVLTPNKVHNRVQHVRIDLYPYLVCVRGAIIDFKKTPEKKAPKMSPLVGPCRRPGGLL